VALQVEDLVETPDGLRVIIRRSKTDQEGQGAEVAILRSFRLRPVEAVRSWLAAGISTGPVFRPVLKGGRVQAVPLSASSAAQIVKTYAERAGLDPAAYAGHSLRAGFLTSAAEAGASVFKMMESPGAPQPLPAHQGIAPTAAARPARSVAAPPRSATHEPPTGSEGVKATLRGIRRTIGSAKQGKAARWSRSARTT
jgi:hypothetical protein